MKYRIITFTEDGQQIGPWRPLSFFRFALDCWSLRGIPFSVEFKQ